MPRRMATEANGVGSRAPAPCPTVAGSPPDTVGGPTSAATDGARRAEAPVVTPDARAARVALQAKTSTGARPTVATTAVATRAPATSGLPILVAVGPPVPATPLVPCEARVDGLWQATDTIHDAVQVPKTGGAAIAAPTPMATTCQVTTRTMRRLLRMQGGPATATAVVAARRGTCPRQAPGARVLVLGLAAPQAMPSGAPAAKLEDVGVVARTAAEAPLPHALREVRGPGTSLVARRRAVGAAMLPSTLTAAAGASLPTGRGRARAARRATGATRACSATPLRGIAAPSPAHGLGPTPVGAVRVALVVGSLRSSTVPVAGPMVPDGRPMRAAVEAPLLAVVAPRIPSAVRAAGGAPLVPIVVPEGPVPQDRQPAEEGPLVGTRVPTALVVREAVRVAGLPLALVAIRVGATMPIGRDGVVKAVWLPPTRVALHEVGLHIATVNAATPTYTAHVAA